MRDLKLKQIILNYEETNNSIVINAKNTDEKVNIDFKKIEALLKKLKIGLATERP